MNLRMGASAAAFLFAAGCGGDGDRGFPVDREALEARFVEAEGRVPENLFSLERIHGVVKGGEGDLRADFSGVRTLLDGGEIDPAKIYGTLRVGPYPFEGEEAAFAYKRYRIRRSLVGGEATLGVHSLFEEYLNSEGWTDGGLLAVRFELRYESPGRDRDLGIYDTFVRFRRSGETYEVLPTVVEGPFVSLVTSDDPGRIVIALRTSVPAPVRVLLSDGRTYDSRGGGLVHEIPVTGLEADREYAYRVEVAGAPSRSFPFRTAPKKGRGEVLFAYTGDSREGRGGGDEEFMGVNHRTLVALTAVAYREGADFLLVGGDLVNGYTTSPEDFEAQLRAWKQAVAGFGNSRPLYPCMGNHEALLRVFDLGEGRTAYLDRWPYETESAEAVFAREFVNPENGPEPSDRRRPPYRENVYSFRYGPVLCIAFNNNYWLNSGYPDAGGCPEGYILEDQLRWIEEELERAEKEKSVRFVILFGQEPFFPNGGHLDDAMWYDGDNRVRATTFVDGRIREEEAGMIEVRNRLVRAVARCSKTAAVLGADEHGYHRTLIGKDVPVGDPSKDDRDGDGVIRWPDEPCSPLRDLDRDVWYIVGAGGGAPYYAEEPSPWNDYWKGKGNRGDAYRYTSQECVLLFRTDGKKLSLRVVNPYGEVIDEVPDLMRRK